MDGWHGRYLRIDPRPGRTACVASGDRLYRDFRGSVGLGTWIVAHEMPAGTDPLVPEAALAYACSPLVGSPPTTLATFAVVGAQPADRPGLRRAGVVALRDRGQAGGDRRAGDRRRVRDAECSLRGRDVNRRTPVRVAIGGAAPGTAGQRGRGPAPCRERH